MGIRWWARTVSVVIATGIVCGVGTAIAVMAVAAFLVGMIR